MLEKPPCWSVMVHVHVWAPLIEDVVFLLCVANKLTYQLVLLANAGETRYDAPHAVVVDWTVVVWDAIAASCSLLQSRWAKDSGKNKNGRQKFYFGCSID